MRPRILTLILTCAALIVIPAATASAGGSAAGQSGPISNETTITYWAYAAHSTPVRVAPNAHAAVVDTIRLSTEDGFPNNYLVIAQKVYPRLTWFRIRIPGRPNGRTGWVPEQALSPLHLTHEHVLVNEHRHILTLYRWQQPIFTAPIGNGKPSTPTPTGQYWIREKFKVHADPFYGPYAFGTADYSTLSEWPNGGVVGIHGTDQPNLIPGAPSHGCIRLKDSDIIKLWLLLKVGTPVTIR
jgi:hypothetical protein